MPADGIPINIDPTLFQVGPFVVTWHGVFTAVATLLGIWLAVKLAPHAGFTEDDTISVAMWGVVGAVLGARVFNVVDQWSYYSANPGQIFLINEGGLALWGAILGGVVAGALYARSHKLDVPRLADLASVPLVLGMAIGRIGDIINGEHHGTHAAGFPLSFVYTSPNTLGEQGVPVHLAVGYELIWDLVVFGALVWLSRAMIRSNGRLSLSWSPRYPRDGMLWWIFLALYSAGRFVVQFYRVDTPFMFGLSQGQLLAAVLGIVSIWILVYQAARTRPATTAPPSVDSAPASPGA